MSCKYNNCKHCGYKSECEIYKENTELEEKISILLSCKNCPNNKGGYICQKEYENKCLSQKIQYIKELQEENAELKEKVKWYSEKVFCKECAEVWGKAKEILKKYHYECPAKYSFEDIDDMAEQFLKECE